MKEKIEEFLLKREELQNELCEYVKDKTIPLESRWDLFMSSDLGEEQSCILRLKSYNLDKFYDKEWFDRGQTIDMDYLSDFIYDIILCDYEEEDPMYKVLELKAEPY